MSNDTNEHAAAVHRRDLASIIRLLVAAAFAVAIVLVALDNRDEVRIGYVVGESTAPLWIVVVASALGGIIIGWLVRHRRQR